MDKLKKALSGNDGDEERGIMAQISDSSSLSWSTRIKGFIACFLIGFLLSLLSSMSVFLANYKMFGVLYTFGNVLALSSTCFLMGPVNQIKKMFSSSRIIATVVMLTTLVLTLLAALVWKNGGLVLILVLIQFLAMTWYSLSYIPYARDAVMKCFESCLNWCGCSPVIGTLPTEEDLRCAISCVLSIVDCICCRKWNVIYFWQIYANF